MDKDAFKVKCQKREDVLTPSNHNLGRIAGTLQKKLLAVGIAKRCIHVKMIQIKNDKDL